MLSLVEILDGSTLTRTLTVTELDETTWVMTIIKRLDSPQNSDIVVCSYDNKLPKNVRVVLEEKRMLLRKNSVTGVWSALKNASINFADFGINTTGVEFVDSPPITRHRLAFKTADIQNTIDRLIRMTTISSMTQTPKQPRPQPTRTRAYSDADAETYPRTVVQTTQHTIVEIKIKMTITTTTSTSASTSTSSSHASRASRASRASPSPPESPIPVRRKTKRSKKTQRS